MYVKNSVWRPSEGARALIQYKMSSYQYRKSRCGDKTVVRSSYLHNEMSYTRKMTYLYETNPRRPFRYKDAVVAVKEFPL